MSTSQSNKIGVSTATIVGMNAMIGAGIFALPSALANKVGPAVIVSFLFAAVSVWFIAQSFARVAQVFPQEGSFYTYARQWGGHGLGLLASGMYIAGLLIAMGLLSQAAGEHLVHYFPSFDAQTLGAITLAILTIINMLGVSLSSVGQQILIVCTVFPLIATTAMCLTKADFSNLTPFAPHGGFSIIQATRIVVFSLFGFEASASLFNVIQNPEKNLPKAVTYSLVCVAGLYLAFVIGLVLAVPLHLFAAYPGPIAGPLVHVFPNAQWVIEMIHFSSISAILGTLHSMIWSSGALLLSFIKKLRSPIAQHALGYNILNQSTATGIIGLCIFATFVTLQDESFFNLTAVFVLGALMLSIITLLNIKEEWDSGQNYITLAGLATGGTMIFVALQSIVTSW